MPLVCLLSVNIELRLRHGNTVVAAWWIPALETRTKKDWKDYAQRVDGLGLGPKIRPENQEKIAQKKLTLKQTDRASSKAPPLQVESSGPRCESDSCDSMVNEFDPTDLGALQMENNSTIIHDLEAVLPEVGRPLMRVDLLHSKQLCNAPLIFQLL